MYPAAFPPWTFPRSSPRTYAVLLDPPATHPGGSVEVRCEGAGAGALGSSPEHAPRTISPTIASA